MTVILELKADNFKRLRAVTIRPDGHTVVIGGRNAQGKTSALDAIEAVLGGGRHCPEEPLRRGARKGFAEIKLDEVPALELDGLTIRRTFSQGSNSKLEVRSSDGLLKSPQAILDKLLGTLSFDPLAFLRQDRHKQTLVLKQVAGLDFTELDKAIAKFVDERKEGKVLVASLKQRADGTESFDGVPDKEVSVDELLAELESQRKENEAIDELEGLRARANAALQARQSDLDALRANLVDANNALVEAENAMREMRDEHIPAADTVLLAATDAVNNATRFDPNIIREQLSAAGETNRKVRANVAHKEAALDLFAAEAVLDTSEGNLTTTRAQKARLIEDAEYPVEGLSVDDDGVLFRGFPLSQASGAEGLKVSAAIGLALNPDLRVLLIRDGSLLDADSMAALAEIAKEADAQIWIERVGDGEEVGIVIEDGEVLEVRESEVAE